MDRANEYLRVQVQTADSGKLILMLYQKAINSLRKAGECLDKGDMEGKGREILRCQEIILELLASLDARAGQITKSLASLYVFIYRKLNAANLGKDRKSIDEAISLLTPLTEAWEEMVKRPLS